MIKMFAAACGAFGSAMLWAATRLDEPFYACVAVFAAAFWGALAACCVWDRICRWHGRDDLPEASVIMPQLRQTGRRP